MEGESPPGFIRVDKPGQRVHFLTIPKLGHTTRRLSNRAQAAAFLEKEGINDISLEQFDFTQGKRKSGTKQPGGGAVEKQVRLSDVFGSDEELDSVDDGPAAGVDVGKQKCRFNLQNLIRSGVKLDHKKILEETACMLDTFRLCENEPEFEEARLAKLKVDLNNSASLEEMAVTMGTRPEGLQAMAQVVEEHCLQELITLSKKEGPLPLSEWPNSTSENWFSEVVKFAMRNSPVTLSLILRMSVKDLESNVQPR
jgi:hypothetical protein